MTPQRIFKMILTVTQFDEESITCEFCFVLFDGMSV